MITLVRLPAHRRDVVLNMLDLLATAALLTTTTYDQHYSVQGATTMAGIVW